MAYRATTIGSLLTSPDLAQQKHAKSILQKALKDGGGNLAEAARILGVPWKTAYRWMAKAGIHRDQAEHVHLTGSAIARAGRRAGSVGEAAKALGVSRVTLAKHAKAEGITLPDGRRAADK